MRAVSHKRLKDFYETKGCEDSCDAQYEIALAKIEELLPIVDDNTPVNDINAVELSVWSDLVIEYEKMHFPIRKHVVSKLTKIPLEEMEMA